MNGGLFFPWRFSASLTLQQPLLICLSLGSLLALLTQALPSRGPGHLAEEDSGHQGTKTLVLGQKGLCTVPGQLNQHHQELLSQ